MLSKFELLMIKNNNNNNNNKENDNQCPLAEWLRRWANLGVITSTELLGGRGFESHSWHE